MTGKLSTHVLDTARGKPAAGMTIRLFHDETQIASAITNREGRTDAPLVASGALRVGVYRIEFDVGDYFASLGDPDAGRFLDVVPIVFRIDDAAQSYHVPLLVSPWAYSTYRGS